MTKYDNNHSAIHTLVTNYRRFRRHQAQYNDLFDRLVKNGQTPKVLMIACCDSRINPNIILDAQPGDLFMFRNIANIVPPYQGDQRHHGTRAALEFSVLGLEVTDIIILGHSHCGGIRALMENTNVQTNNTFQFVLEWMEIMRPIQQTVFAHHKSCSLDQQSHYCELASLLESYNNLETYPWIQQRLQNQQLFRHAWYFDLSTQTITSYQQDSKSFAPLLDPHEQDKNR